MYSACKNKTVLVTSEKQVVSITLNRPDQCNAFDAIMVDELIDAFVAVSKDTDARAVVLRGKGKHFCAGADVHWMQSHKDGSAKENQSDALKLAELMHQVNECPVPVICVVQGHAYGGGVGLVACSDIVLADRSARFCLSETRLGLIPAVIGPYVISAIGLRQTRRFMLTAEPITIASALEHDLVHELHDVGKADQALAEILRHVMLNGPLAIREAKAYLKSFAIPVDMKASASLIAKLRTTDEAQEGMKAFLESRRPSWVEEL